MTDPAASRPRSAGHEFTAGPEALLPWAWARTRLERIATWWIATGSAEGDPHAMPVWGAWVADRGYVLGDLGTRWARHLRTRPACVIHVQEGDDVVIVHGRARRVTELPADRLAAIAAGYARYAKPGEVPLDPAEWLPRGFWEIEPVTAFGFSDYLTDATRWRFGG